MIIDKLENIRNYASLVPELDVVADVFESGELENASLGKHETCDPNVFYKVLEYDLELTENNCEIHDEWIDIQYIHKGLEIIAMPVDMPVSEVSPIDSTDMGWVKASEYRTLWYGDPSNFLLLFPGEPHAPALIADKKRKIRKVVFKIRKRS